MQEEITSVRRVKRLAGWGHKQVVGRTFTVVFCSLTLGMVSKQTKLKVSYGLKMTIEDSGERRLVETSEDLEH